MREIILDTESTGLAPEKGHRLVEIGCVEIENLLPTGKTFHVYLNPQRDMPMEAQQIHGLSAEFLADKPLFSAIASDFIAFLGDSPLVIHNAGFDMKFINHELISAGFTALPFERAIDTVLMARKKFPGAPASLDALCRRFGVDNSSRDYHGALLDAQLLAEVYLELRGGRQPNLVMETVAEKKAVEAVVTKIDRTFREARDFGLTPEEAALHEALVASMKNPLWAKN